MNLTTSVIVITLNRPQYLRECLNHLIAQEPLPDEIIVVDSSQDELTHDVVKEIQGVLYLKNASGYGRMTTSRNLGLKHATGDIIAFVDDDAYAHAGWLSNLLSTYQDAMIAAVGGRVLNNVPGEEARGVEEIGRLKADGDLTGNFGADPGRIIEVDHVMGCNMSFRRELILRLGGFREDYPGISGVREDSDMCLRIKRLGEKIVFNPAACVDHVSAPQVKGKRFDPAYAYNGQRNHIVMLIRNFGLHSPMLWRYLVRTLTRDIPEFARRIGYAIAVVAADFVGAIAGIIIGVPQLYRYGRDPVRRDAGAMEIVAAMRCNRHDRQPKCTGAADASTDVSRTWESQV